MGADWERTGSGLGAVMGSNQIIKHLHIRNTCIALFYNNLNVL